MKEVFCANCGVRLMIIRKALPKYGRIIDMVEWHECLDEPVDLNLTPDPVPEFRPMPRKDRRKFAQKLDELTPTMVGTDDLRDRRDKAFIKDEANSTAPLSLLKRLKESGDV